MSDDSLTNPFAALGTDISKPQSIAFAVVYAIFAIIIIFRCFRGVEHTFVYRFMALFSLIRVATFVVRYIAASTNTDDSSYKTIIIVAGVLIVAGFLFIVEAIIDLVVKWYCVIRSITMSSTTSLITHMARHFLLMGASLLGVVGAIKEVDAVDDNNTSNYNTAKHLRQASGVIFLLISGILIISVLVISCMPERGRRTRKVPTSIVLLISCIALLVESIYRIWSASSTTGFIVKQIAIDVLLFAPEVVFLIIISILNLDDLGDVVFAGQTPRTMKEYPTMYPNNPPYIAQNGVYPQQQYAMNKV